LSDLDKKDLENGLFRMLRWVNSTARPESSGNAFDSPIYYLSRDKEPYEGKDYYKKDNESYSKITLTKEDAVSYEYINTKENGNLTDI
jgi:hypothetical protein